MLCFVSLIFAGMAGMGALVTGALLLGLLAIASLIRNIKHRLFLADKNGSQDQKILSC
jgi:hypothetical protein